MRRAPGILDPVDPRRLEARGGVRILGIEDVASLVGGRDLVLIQAHEDDLRVSLGPVLDRMVGSARRATLLDFVGDPEGVLDSFAERYRAEHRHGDGESPRDLKRRVRATEAEAAARVLGIEPERHVRFDFDLEFLDRRLDEAGRFRPYDCRCRPLTPGETERVGDCLEGLCAGVGRGPVFVLPWPDDPHPQHRVISGAVLRALARRDRPARLLFYELWDRFDAVGVGANVLCLYGPRDREASDAILRAVHASQMDRFDYVAAAARSAGRKALHESRRHAFPLGLRRRYMARLLKATLRPDGGDAVPER